MNTQRGNRPMKFELLNEQKQEIREAVRIFSRIS